MHPIERVRSLARASWLDPVTIAVEAADAIADARRWMGEEVAVSMARRLLAWHPFAAPLWYSAGRTVGAISPADAATEVLDELLGDETAVHLDAALPDTAVVGLVGEGLWADALTGAGRRGRSHRHGGPLIGTVESTRHFVPIDEGDLSTDSRMESALAGTTHLLIGAMAVGPGHCLVPRPAVAASSAATRTGTMTWVVAGRASVVDAALWRALEQLHERGGGPPRSETVTDIWWDEPGAEAPALEILTLEEQSLLCGPEGLETTADSHARAFSAASHLLDAAGRPAF